MDATTTTVNAAFADFVGEVPASTSRGREEALEAVVREHRRRVFGLLLGLVSSPEEAEDLTQEVFLRAWRHRARMRANAPAWPWLAAVAVNAARDWHRRRAARLRRDGHRAELEQAPPAAPTASVRVEQR